MKKLYLHYLLLATLTSSVFLVGCEKEADPIPNEAPKVAFSVLEEDFQPLDFNTISSPPVITGTVQSDAGLRQVTIELLKGGETEVLENVSTFDEVSSKIYVFNITPEYTAEVTGLRVSGVDVQDRPVERTLDITVIEKTPELVFSPLDGLVGTKITVTGFNFVEEDIESVMIGDMIIEDFTVAENGTFISFTVPEGAQSGLIKVTLVDGEPMVSTKQFMVIQEPKEIVSHTDVVVNAQGNRNDEGIVTAFSAEGETFTLAQGADEAISEKIDFITADSGGDDMLDLFSPSHESWLPGNYFEDADDNPVIWPVLNQTKLVHLEDQDATFFENITNEELMALQIGAEFETRIALSTPGAGAIILFETAEGQKGLIHFKEHDPNAAEGSKADIFTFDIKVLE